MNTTGDPYYVCDDCAHTWSAPEAGSCEYCRSFAVTEYPDLAAAEDVSDRIMIETGRRRA